LNSFPANWHMWSTGNGDEMINFRGQEVKVQGHRKPNLDLKGCRGIILAYFNFLFMHVFN